MPDMPTLPDGWTLNVLAGWPMDQFAHWPPLERAGNVLLPEGFTGIAHPNDRSDVLFLCFKVQEGEVMLTTVMSSQSDVHTALDRLRRAAPMDTWRRLCIVGMARFLASADPEDLAEEDAKVGMGGMRSEWEKAARAWQSQLQGWGQLNAERAETEPVKRKRNRITREHLEHVAKVYREADADGAPPTRAVQQAFGTTHSTAAKWVAQARKEGILGAAPGSRGGEVGSGTTRLSASGTTRLSTQPRKAGSGANDDLAEVFRSARERSGKTLGDIAKATGLSVYDMTSLEKGNFHRIGWSPQLGPDVRRPQERDRALEVMSQFAQAVGLDPDEIVERYEAERRRHRLEEAKEHAGDRKPPA